MTQQLEMQFDVHGVKVRRAGYNTNPAAAPDFLVEGFIMEGCTAVFSGEPKAGKTQTLVEMMVCIAAGLPFLGHYKTKQGPVLISSPEGPEACFEDRLRLACAAHGVRLEDIPIHLIDRERPLYIDRESDQQILREMVDLIKPALVIIDPLEKHLIGDENNAGDVKRFTQFVTPLAAATKATVIITHHRTKVTANKSAGSSLRGSSALYGFGDTYLFLDIDRHEQRLLYAVQRHFTPLPKMMIKMKATDDAVSLTVDNAPQVEAAAPELEMRILEFMRATPASRFTVEEIRDAMAAKLTRVISSCRHLLAEQLIFRHPLRGYTATKPRERKEKGKETKPAKESGGKKNEKADVTLVA